MKRNKTLTLLTGISMSTLLFACAAKNPGQNNREIAPETALEKSTQSGKKTEGTSPTPQQTAVAVKSQQTEAKNSAAPQEAAYKGAASVPPQTKSTSDRATFKITSSQESPANSPLQVVKNYTEELKSLVEIEEASKEKDADIANKVRQFFDFDELAKRSLGKHWEKRSRAEQKRYQTLFIQLIESSYLRRSKDLIGNFQVNFKDNEEKENFARVTSTVSRDDADVDIAYELHQNAQQWVIYNIIMDDLNLIRNYQSQFNQIVKKKGFAHLISLMEERLKNQKNQPDVNL